MLAANAAGSQNQTCKCRAPMRMPSSAHCLMAPRWLSLRTKCQLRLGSGNARGFALLPWSSYTAARHPSPEQHRCRRASAELH